YATAPGERLAVWKIEPPRSCRTSLRAGTSSCLPIGMGPGSASSTSATPARTTSPLRSFQGHNNVATCSAQRSYARLTHGDGLMPIWSMTWTRKVTSLLVPCCVHGLEASSQRVRLPQRAAQEGQCSARAHIELTHAHAATAPRGGA